ncbi:hypothetical protein, partial [Xanthomonas arboricola]
LNQRIFEPFSLWFRVCGTVASGEANYRPNQRVWEGVCEKNFTIFPFSAVTRPDSRLWQTADPAQAFR